MKTQRTLMIAAGGTGGHIMPGLAVAEEMRARGWNVVWLGHPERMEGKLVPAHGIDILPLRFAGVRGKGAVSLLKLPFSLSSALSQASVAFRQAQPDVVLGMGGYVAFPAGLMAKIKRVPLVIHEQNAVAGSANRWLAKMAQKVLVGFPGALPGALVVGNPVRPAVLQLGQAQERYAARTGPLRLLVLGGSLGAQPLNRVVPEALAQLPPALRPAVVHQTGAQHLQAVQADYQRLGVQAACHEFIEDVPYELAQADLLVCRAGAMTVAEVAAAGVAALFVPLPHAIDDHQRANARYLTDCQGGWLQDQKELTPQWLAEWLAVRTRAELSSVAQHAHQHASPQATQHIADACEQVARGTL
ncbi:undecaprenyldiphospho-muramoylpentapeptide beta-N-acetylglucosaminyltransferase [Pusillimonas sp. CC-YST705]|uniref:UDP-N-acetylglucosamine--N-acetylmuramyl-(pentapeptide) pyrophosphoryl-undecaprenol N-acetylglucosamine transferase n=1 Tax=Mesopusillimonas faecipullorum TaxID=2755040 RepID=A0ABS8CAF2_9BURK|nr:undecaprenyldiphospho-muramoylpentapeptide beta-N-acetylglucosaminyltransferase [Mesopusillimonas faecipullorum]MCB5362604.1 undecaprenyldiphospho-muramoylpentapeptide beta-N-acetylglucosaminyltransferase [Mesopusillimonas faecipullorum]